MKPRAECYFVLLNLHGPEELYRPLYELLEELLAVRIEGGFPVWLFNGEPDSHTMYQERFRPLLPPWSVYRPDILYGFLLMSARGYSAFGKCELGS